MDLYMQWKYQTINKMSNDYLFNIIIIINYFKKELFLNAYIACFTFSTYLMCKETCGVSAHCTLLP